MPGNSRIIAVDPLRPSGEAMDEAVAAMARGGMVIFPTRCLYGLAVDALNPEAVARIFTAKQRPQTNPVLVLIPGMSFLETLVAHVPPWAERIMAQFWPGDVTLVFSAGPELPPRLTAGTGKIGVRLPRHPVAQALVAAAGIPITGTSANLSGEAGCFQVSDLPPRLVQAADLVLDAGPLRGGTGSTVVDVTCTPPRILRQGGVDGNEILQFVSGLC